MKAGFRKTTAKAVLGVMILGLLTMVPLPGNVSIFPAMEVSATDNNPAPPQASTDATNEDKDSAYSNLATYTNNLIVINKEDGIENQLKDMLENAKNYIYNKFSGTSSQLSEYVTNVKSQMDAVIGTLPVTTSEFLALSDTYQTPTVKYGQDVIIALPIVNFSTVPLSDVVVRPQISNLVAEWPFEPNSAGTSKVIKNFPPFDANKPMESIRQDVAYLFKVRSDVMSGFYPLKFDVTYNRKGKVEKATLITYVKTIGKADSGSLDGKKEEQNKENISKARIIVTGFETNPPKVFAGDTFSLTVHVQNTSKSHSVTNVLFDMQAVEEGTDKNNTFAAFLPTSGSSSIYVDSIGAGATKDLTIEMSAKSDLAQKPYVLTLNMKYDMKDAMDLTDTAKVSVPIYQEQRCETGDAEIAPESINVGGQANVMFDVYNTGKTTLYNTWVKFKADSISGGDTFLGTIASGATGSVDAMITGAAATMDDGTIIAEISFENESGEITTVEKTLNLMVMEEMMGEEYMGEDMGMEGMGEMGEMEQPASGGLLSVLKWIIPVIVVIAVIVLVVVLKKRKAKKLEQAELAADIDALEEKDGRR